MSTNLFYFLWALFAVIFVVILAVAGKISGKGLPGALIDSRNRYSLNRFQILMWTVLIFSAFAALFFAQGLVIPVVSAHLLGLVGISAASATTAGAVKSSKDIMSAAATTPQIPKILPSKNPRPIQMILEEEGDFADEVVNVTKFQNMILTLVAGVAFVAMVVDQMTLDLELSDQFLWLLGISHTTYVAAKVPNRK